MKKYRVLFNPKSGNGRGEADVHKLENIWPEADFSYSDITAISDIPGYLTTVPEDTGIILAGGDGTVNHFINDLGGKDPGREILYFATGTGNDFLNDIGVEYGAPPLPSQRIYYKPSRGLCQWFGEIFSQRHWLRY